MEKCKKEFLGNFRGYKLQFLGSSDSKRSKMAAYETFYRSRVLGETVLTLVSSDDVFDLYKGYPFSEGAVGGAFVVRVKDQHGGPLYGVDRVIMDLDYVSEAIIRKGLRSQGVKYSSYSKSLFVPDLGDVNIDFDVVYDLDTDSFGKRYSGVKEFTQKSWVGKVKTWISKLLKRS